MRRPTVSLLCALAIAIPACSQHPGQEPRAELADLMASHYDVERTCALKALAGVDNEQLAVLVRLMKNQPVSGALVRAASWDAFASATSCPTPPGTQGATAGP